MVQWQRRTRLGLAVFGIVFAFVVYAAIGEREPAAPTTRPERLDPKAILESAGAALQQFRATTQDYVIEADRQLTYEDGATTFIGVTITVRGRGGRDFVVTGREARAGSSQEELEIEGDVTLEASDGFVMTVDRAAFSETDATVRSSGPVSFHRGRMSGSGVGMSYDREADVLAITEDAQVEVVGEDGAAVMSFTAGSAMLARQEDYLALEGSVHALRGEQVLEADRGLARLTPEEEYVTFIELRGNARVSGGGTFDAMSARDIDLDYTEDGEALERVVLDGGGAIALAGRNEAPGRQFLGESLDLAFAPDGALISLAGRGNVRVDLPAAGGEAPARSVLARAVDGSGEAGRGLTSARFTDEVEFREERGRTTPPRVARSRSLQLTLAGDAVSAAVFNGNVRFEDGGLQASGATAHYDPDRGTLRLSGAEGGVGPRVADERISIEAESIDVGLDDRRMSSRGGVRTTLQARTGASADGRLPGLLEQGEAANVNADTLDYQGAAGTAVYSGSATLWQGETAIRADVITLDQATGDLVASGNARSTLALDTGLSVGRAGEIRYDDKARQITYGSPAPTPVSPVAPTNVSPVAPTSVSPLAPTQLNGPQGDVQASRIEIVLAKTGSRAERLEAYTDVEVRLDTRVATGDRLTYHADDEQYDLTGIATVPVRVVEACRETIGRTMTFFKASDRIIVDGNEEVRTQASRGGPCPAPPAR
jgi:lipopolysaccharide export system protein LptA